MWELEYKESRVPKNCFWTVVLEKTLESPLDSKEIQPVHPKGDQSWVSRKDWCWSWNSSTLATWCEELTHWKRPWWWERLKAGGEGVDRGWDGWMALPTQRAWVWVNSRSWWWTRRPGMLQCMGSQRVWTRLSDWTDSQSRRSLFREAHWLLWPTDPQFKCVDLGLSFPSHRATGCVGHPRLPASLSNDKHPFMTYKTSQNSLSVSKICLPSLQATKAILSNSDL